MRKVFPERRERVESAEVQALRQEILELQRQATMTEVEVERLRRLVAELQAGQEQAGLAPAPETRDRELDVARQSMPEASGPVIIEVPPLEVEDLEPVEGISAVERGVAASDRLVPKATGSEGPAGEDEASSQPAVATPVTEEGQAVYDRGYTAFHQGQYLDAETTFQQFLAEFRATDLGDNAQFWIGEARYARRDLSGAMAAFREVVNRHPEGNKVPDALLKVGDCQHGLGDIEGARRSYQSVVDRFPLAAAAAVAEDRLRELP
jgi:tol-pal system protein YbgF